MLRSVHKQIWLQHRFRYKPLLASDVWALGLVMLEVVGGQRPGRHNELFGSEEYRQELYREDLSVFDASDAPGHYNHLRYLSDMLTEPGSQIIQCRSDVFPTMASPLLHFA